MDVFVFYRGRGLLYALCLLLDLSSARAEPQPAAVVAFEAYRAVLEDRFVVQHGSGQTILAPCAGDPATAAASLRRGDLIIEQVAPGGDSAHRAEAGGALLHHWRGTAFVAGARAGDFVKLMQDFDRYPQRFAPQIERVRVLKHDGTSFDVSMRIRQKHVFTVVMDTEYAIQFRELDAEHGYSISRSTRVAEIASPGTASEHVLSAGEEHGFLWRLNTYWSYEERDGGLYLQLEALSLTRAIPAGLGWVIRPYVESIPRESMEFTLRSTANALRR